MPAFMSALYNLVRIGRTRVSVQIERARSKPTSDMEVDKTVSLSTGRDARPPPAFSLFPLPLPALHGQP